MMTSPPTASSIAAMRSTAPTESIPRSSTRSLSSVISAGLHSISVTNHALNSSSDITSVRVFWADVFDVDISPRLTPQDSHTRDAGDSIRTPPADFYGARSASHELLQLPLGP